MLPSLSRLVSQPKSRLIGVGAGLILILLVLTACGGGGATSAGAQSYIATIDGAPASARVGIVVEGNQFAVYTCSLDDGFNLTSARWYTGTIDSSGNVSGVSPDGVEFKGLVQGGQFSGTIVDLNKKTWNFKGSQVPAGSSAGLYRGTGQYNGQDIIIGAVISPDGSFASTVQYKGKIEFVSPVASEPAGQSNGTVTVKIGPSLDQADATLVTTLQGVDLS
jgi:fermentation-respiration switch protein FrsA (DUF1100 family)